MKSFNLQIFETENEGTQTYAPRQTGRRDLLEQTKLSRLPRRDNVLAFGQPAPALCANCGDRLNAAVEFQTTVSLCGECLRNYASINAILDAHVERKIKGNIGRINPR